MTIVNVDERNRLFLSGSIDRDDLWPKIKEYEDQRFQFRWDFGLNELPAEPGLITIRGARQTGKSTWLEMQLLETLEDYGLGSAFFLNCDYILSLEEFEAKLIELENSFSITAKVKRIFIDEITSIKDWERVLKRVLDAGHLKDVLIVTTGSNAADLRRGVERLPGRKGRLQTTEYVFLPISFREFRYQVRDEVGTFPQDVLWSYLLSGGSPLATHGLYYSDKLDDSFINLIKDWIFGDIVASGRSRIFLMNIFKKIHESATSPISYTKLAKEAGLSNNTAALDYIEKLADLLCIYPMLCWDEKKKVGLARKASKFPFINLAAAWCFHPLLPRFIDEIKSFEGQHRGAVYEWAVAQELWRRQVLAKQSGQTKLSPELFYWKSAEHEIDFVTADESMFEVKAGTCSPSEFAWFYKTFPKKHLVVISESEYESKFMKSQSLSSFLTEAPSELYYDSDKADWI